MSRNSRPSLIPIRSVLGRRSRAPEPSTSAGLAVGANVQPPNKRLDAGWGALRESLRIVERCSDMCLPLKAAVGGLLGVLEYVEKIKDAQEELIAIASKIEALSGVLTRFTNGVPAHIGKRLDALANAIDEHAAIIDAKKQRGLLRRIVEASDDGQEIVKAFRDISFLVDVFTMHTSISTDIAVNQATRNALLNRLGHVPEAEFNRADRLACMEGTREKLLNELMVWALDSHSPPVFWLNGMAGTGKTTITESFCRMLHIKGILAARQFPAISESLAHTLEEEPDIASCSLEVQFTKLISEPLERAFYATLPMPIFVIDALDECDDQKGVSNLIDIILRCASESALHAKFVLTSRPEARIRSKFVVPESPLHSIVRLHDIEQVIVEADILLYVRRRLGSIPDLDLDGEILVNASGEINSRIKELVSRAGKFFIYAASTCDYILGPEGDPKTRLDNLLSGGRLSRTVGRNLDGHYAFIMNEAMLNQDDSEIKDMRRVLYFVLLGKDSLSVADTACFLKISRTRLRTSLASLHSIIHVPSTDLHNTVSAFHASFGDYLKDSERSGGERWHLVTARAHHYLAVRCIDAISGLHFDPVASESSYFPSRKKSSLSALNYASRFLAYHLKMLRRPQSLYRDLLQTFRTAFLFWVSLHNESDTLVVAKDLLVQLLEINQLDSALLNFVQDAKLFTDDLFSVAHQGSPHFYLSVLPLTHCRSEIGKYFHPLFRNTVRYCGGQNLNAEKLRLNHTTRFITTSPDGRMILSVYKCRIQSVWDARTGLMLSGDLDEYNHRKDSPSFAHLENNMIVLHWIVQMRMSLGLTEKIRSSNLHDDIVAVSSNGQRVACSAAHRTIHVVYIIDVEDSKLVDRRLEGIHGYVTSLKFSRCGNRLVSGSNNGTLHIWDMHKHEQRGVRIRGGVFSITSVDISSDNNTIVFGDERGVIQFWDLCGLRAAGEPIRAHTTQVNVLGFSPSGSTVVSSSDNILRVWSVTTKEAACDPLEGHTTPVVSIVFSLDEKTIISISQDGIIRLWDSPEPEILVKPLAAQRNTYIHDTSLLSWPFRLKLGPGWSRELCTGWILGPQGEHILWLSHDAHDGLMTPRVRLILNADPIYLDFSRFKHGESWTECYTPDQDDQSDTVPSEIGGLPVYGPRNFIP